MPGCSSISEVLEALEAGADMIKAFPTSSLHGPGIVSTIKTPLPFVPILSSGGVSLTNVTEWLNAGVECMGVGTLLTKGSQAEIAKNATRLRKEIDTFMD